MVGWLLVWYPNPAVYLGKYLCARQWARNCFRYCTTGVLINWCGHLRLHSPVIGGLLVWYPNPAVYLSKYQCARQWTLSCFCYSTTAVLNQRRWAFKAQTRNLPVVVRLAVWYPNPAVYSSKYSYARQWTLSCCWYCAWISAYKKASWQVVVRSTLSGPHKLECSTRCL